MTARASLGSALSPNEPDGCFGIDNTEIVHAVHERPAPMISATNGLRLAR